MSNLIATRDAYGEALVKLGDKEDFLVFDADLSCATKTNKFNASFPERFFQMGIAEQDMMGTAAGVAATGLNAIVSTFALFATGRAYEQIRNSIAYPDLNVKIAASHSGITVGPDGGSHQSIEDITLMRVVPNMNVFVPADVIETEQILEKALKIDGPCYIRLGRNKIPVILDENYSFEPGKSEILVEGDDITLAATGMMVSEAIKASDILKETGIKARVINVSSIKPLDQEQLLKAARETGTIITIEEHSIYGGLGSAVSEIISENNSGRVVKMGLKDTFGQSGAPEDLLKYYNLTVEDIVNTVKKVV